MSSSLPTVAIFVDVQNVYYTTRQRYGKNFDYNKFWKFITQDQVVVKAFAYAIERGDKKQQEFQNILRAIGFDVKLKPYIKRADGSSKGDWDVGITIDVLEHAPLADTVVLVSGDGDFDLLVTNVRQKHHKQVKVVGVPGLTAGSLIDAADQYIPIDNELLLG